MRYLLQQINQSTNLFNQYRIYNQFMIEKESTFKSQAFSLHGQQFLYQIHTDNQNSQIVIYNNEAKIRSTQHFTVPAHNSSYTCENFLVLLSEQEIFLYEIPNLGAQRSCPNPGVKKIIQICYNHCSNLIFFVDSSNRLYYIMPQINQFKVRKIFDNQIQGKINKIAVDEESVIHLLSNETQTLHSLTFDWNQKDKLVNYEKQENVVDIYCRFKWKALIKQHQNDKEYYSLNVFQNMSDADDFSCSVPKFQLNNLPIIKGTINDLVYVDGHSRSIILINNGQLIAQHDLQIKFPVNSKSNNFLFQLKKTSYNKILLKFHYFKGLGEQFINMEIPLNQINNKQQQENIYLYIHNNIHLILTQMGLSAHFTEKVREYIGNDDYDIGHEQIVCLLMEKLLRLNSVTAVKLANHLVSKRNTYLATTLKRYLSYIYDLLKRLIQEIQQSKKDGVKCSQSASQKKYGDKKAYIQNIITFVSILYCGVRNQEQKNYSLIHNLNGRSQSYSYYKCVQKCKSLYLLNQILFSNIQLSRYSGEDMEKAIPAQNQEIDAYLNKNNLKIGFNACHQFFNPSFPHMLTFQQIFSYVKECQNFYQAAYFYMLSSNFDSIPYIGDPETSALIKFLTQVSIYQILNNKQKAKLVLKSLPKMTSKALLLNQPTFLKFLCCLSINSEQYNSCLAILLSGSTKQWSLKQQKFIIQCLILCNHTQLAYAQISNRGNPQQRKMLMDQFVSLSIKQRRVKDLLLIEEDQEQKKSIRDRLKNQFGDDINGIINLMKTVKDGTLLAFYQGYSQ